jgi:hypothetical protein
MVQPYETLLSSSTFMPSPVVIKNSKSVSFTDVSKSAYSSSNVHNPHVPLSPLQIPGFCPPTAVPTYNITALSEQLQSLALVVWGLSLPASAAQDCPSASAPHITNNLTASPPVPKLLSTMSSDKIIMHVHHKGTVFPLVCPCDTTNTPNPKTHWSAKGIQRAMGCRKFCNYKHLLQVSRDVDWVNGGEFPPLLGSYATTPKEHWGKALDQICYQYLDVVHIIFVFGDGLSVGGFKYALILVDQATCSNLTFGLKDLLLAPILSAFCLICDSAGSLVLCFYCNCETQNYLL